jgi:hypothetical protein
VPGAACCAALIPRHSRNARLTGRKRGKNLAPFAGGLSCLLRWQPLWPSLHLPVLPGTSAARSITPNTYNKQRDELS